MSYCSSVPVKFFFLDVKAIPNQRLCWCPSLYSFLDKMYILSSEEAYQKFITNPRPYLLPPMPRFPCRVCIIGPPQAGTTTLCRLLAQSYNALVLDVDELLKPVLSKEEQERIDKIKEEATLTAIDMVKRNLEEGIEQTSGKFCFFNKTFCTPLPQNLFYICKVFFKSCDKIARFFLLLADETNPEEGIWLLWFCNAHLCFLF